MMSQCDMRLVWLWEVIESRNLQETGIHDEDLPSSLRHRMVKYRVVNCQDTKPTIGEIFRYGRAQSPEGGDVVERADE